MKAVSYTHLDVYKRQAKHLQAISTYGFDCSIEVFGHIGKGYVYNPEFKENIDKFGPGTAQYTSDVICLLYTSTDSYCLTIEQTK